MKKLGRNSSNCIKFLVAFYAVLQFAYILRADFMRLLRIAPKFFRLFSGRFITTWGWWQYKPNRIPKRGVPLKKGKGNNLKK